MHTVFIVCFCKTGSFFVFLFYPFQLFLAAFVSSVVWCRSDVSEFLYMDLPLKPSPRHHLRCAIRAMLHRLGSLAGRPSSSGTSLHMTLKKKATGSSWNFSSRLPLVFCTSVQKRSVEDSRLHYDKHNTAVRIAGVIVKMEVWLFKVFDWGGRVRCPGAQDKGAPWQSQSPIKNHRKCRKGAQLKRLSPGPQQVCWPPCDYRKSSSSTVQFWACVIKVWNLIFLDPS